jgi:hypothetical protein
VEQVSVALARLQAWPQAPQFVRELSCVSHPLLATPSQLPYPALHVPSWQAPPKQTADALAKVQFVVQFPQCAASLLKFDSQPLLALLSQLPKPELQVIPHTPPLHVAVPLVLLHEVAQFPQRVGVVLVFVSHPFVALASQLPQPAAHVPSWHVPAGHVAPALANEHALPQVPQFEIWYRLVSQPLFTLPSQLPQPAVHVGTHSAFEHVVAPWALEHATPHAPQFAALVSEVSQPLTGLPSQSPNPVLQAPSWQMPEAHTDEALAKLQALVQSPQCRTSVLRLASHPLVSSPSQLP